MEAQSGHRRQVPDWLRWRSSVSPDALALKIGSLEWTYRELQDAVSALTAVLQSRGIRKGTRVALLMRPSEAYVSLIHAAARLGAVAVPLSQRQSVPELRALLRDSAPSLVVHDETFAARADELGRSATARWALASEFVADSTSGGRQPVVGDKLDVGAPHAIIYTSGSSGAPKGVVVTLGNLMWNAISVGIRSGAFPEDRWLLCMPLFHVGGYTIIFRSVLHGSGVVLHPRFDPKRVSLSLDNDGITLTSLVPTMLNDVLEARGGKPLSPTVRVIFLGGGQPRPQLVAAIRKRRLPVLLTYGMTETCSQVAVSKVSASEDGPAYLPLFPSRVTVTKLAKRARVEPAGPGEVGEVAVSGPTLFGGYWRKPVLTKARFRGGWFLTGDLGYIQPAAGRRGWATAGIAILGRKDETIVSGGEKVFPAEVESALREHPAVVDAVVVGVDDAKWGQRVVAVVQKAELRSSAPSATELNAFLRERVAGYKLPKEYHFWEALPRTPTGKARRGEVRALLEGGDAPG